MQSSSFSHDSPRSDSADSPAGESDGWLFARCARGEIDTALQRYAQYDQGCPQRLSEAIRHSLLAPGKRLRPMLVLMAAQACGCDRRAAMPAACAVEMVHTYSLIHDDLPAMDDDDLRRGRPSCHAAFGEATAILAGDALLAQAFETISRDVQPPDTAARCCLELATAAGAAALVGGQSDDLAEEERQDGINSDTTVSNQIDPNEPNVRTERTPSLTTSSISPPAAPSLNELARLESIHRRKTGAMFRVSLRLGGIVAHTGADHLAALTRYGEKMGLAFQIVDDLLDHSGEEQALGKRVQKDSQRGKLTFPIVLGVDASRRRASELIAQARGAIVSTSLQSGPLEELAQYVLERNR